MGLLILNPGTSATVQDRGRAGYREFGVPEGGAFDRSSFGMANALVGNGPGEAALELTLVGGVYRATHRLALALAGAPMTARIEGRDGLTPLAIPQSFALDEGDRLVLGGSARGVRAYLAVRGGWRTAPFLGGRSSERRLEAGETLPAEAGTIATRRPARADLPDPADGPIRLVDGPDGPVPPALLGSPYWVGGASDRIGLRLDGPAIVGADRPGRASSPTAAGAVQVAGGRAIVLGVAGGTMGGYPHVAHVIAADLDRLAQARPGAPLTFARIEPAEARRLDRDRRARLAVRDRRIGLAAGAGAGD